MRNNFRRSSGLSAGDSRVFACSRFLSGKTPQAAKHLFMVSLPIRQFGKPYYNAMSERERKPVQPLSRGADPGQRTLGKSIGCHGVGIHSGRDVRLTLGPASAGDGFVFRRLDVADDVGEVPARWDTVVDTTLCTVLSNEHGVNISTPEHVLAALTGAGIDNATIEVDGPELPIMDGSSDDFTFMIDCAGIRFQPSRPRRRIEVLKPVRVQDGESWARLLPSDRFTVSCIIDYDHPQVGVQRFDFDSESQTFSEAVGRARTFGFLHELEWLRAQGYARGASLDNTVAISPNGVMNDGGLRYPDELARHKVLDVIGDLALAGAPVLGAFQGFRSGHRLNNLLLRALFADDSAWRWEGARTEAQRVVA